MNILKTICSKKLEEVNFLKEKIFFNKNQKIKCRSFLKHLTKKNDKNYNLIAEIKRSSPSKGVIKKDFDLLKIAGAYVKAGAKCISILTEKNYFGGDISYIQKVKDKFSVPILRKDFILDEWQIYESFYSGADCILLIFAILEDDKVDRFYNISKELGMDVICEVHDYQELSRALQLNVECIGINNRNLNTLKIDLKTFNNLSKSIPKNIIKICESGIDKNIQLKDFSNNGADAFLVGESLMKSKNIMKTTQELIRR